jgi:hypothetical protein
MQTSKDFIGNQCSKPQPAERLGQSIGQLIALPCLVNSARALSTLSEVATTVQLSIAASASRLVRRSTRILGDVLSRTGIQLTGSSKASIQLSRRLPVGVVVSESGQIQGAAPRLNSGFIPRLILGATGLVALVFLSSCAHCPMCGKCGHGMMAAPSAKGSAKEPAMHHGSGHMHRSGHLASGDGEGQPASTPVIQQKSAKAKRANASEPAANKGSEAAPNSLETPMRRSFR